MFELYKIFKIHSNSFVGYKKFLFKLSIPLTVDTSGSIRDLKFPDIDFILQQCTKDEIEPFFNFSCILCLIRNRLFSIINIRKWTLRTKSYVQSRASFHKTCSI